MGRHLEERSGAQMAVVVGSFSYRCHEDREIGFRSLMRQQFEGIEVLEVPERRFSQGFFFDSKHGEIRPHYFDPQIMGGRACI
jgi:hypothetical protein